MVAWMDFGGRHTDWKMAGVQVSEAGLFGGERCRDFRVILRGRGTVP